MSLAHLEFDFQNHIRKKFPQLVFLFLKLTFLPTHGYSRIFAKLIDLNSKQYSRLS